MQLARNSLCAQLAGWLLSSVGVLILSTALGKGPPCEAAPADGLPPEAPPPQATLPESRPSEPAAPDARPPELETPSPEPASQPEPAQPPPPITGARAWLRGHEVDDSQFERLVDGRPTDEGEAEVLWNIMYWLSRLELTALERWTRDPWKAAELARSPDQLRGEIFPVSGRITALDTLAPVPEAIERLDIPRYYRCRIVRSDGQPAVVFARFVPEAWLEAPGPQQAGDTHEGVPAEEPVNYRASARGLFLKLGSDDPRQPLPIFVAARVAWHPDTPLGILGMDVGLFDEVDQRRPLTANDRECFYQMLNAVGHAEPGALLRRAERQLREIGRQRYSVVPLFNDPENQHGRLVALRGVTRRLVRIPVGDPDIVERFGIDHYYEMALYTEESSTAVGGPAPLVFCLRDLPEGMPTGDGPDYAEEVLVAGFFMKTWAYRSQEADAMGEGPKAAQLAPLLIGRRPIWYPRQPPERNTAAAAIAGGLFVLALVGIWIGLWHYSRSDRKFHEQTIAKTHALDSGLSLDEIGLDAEGKPDFRRLSETDESDGDSRP